MPEISDIARLFDRRPKQMGSPAGPVVWNALRDSVCAHTPTETASEFAALLRAEFTRLTGADLGDPAAIAEPEIIDGTPVAVDLPTWRTILLPLLIVRARQLYGELPTERP